MVIRHLEKQALLTRGCDVGGFCFREKSVIYLIRTFLIISFSLFSDLRKNRILYIGQALRGNRPAK